MDKVRVEILGLSTSSFSSGAYALILQEVAPPQRRLPIIIGSFEAQAIAMELEKVKPPRPQTHDLLKSFLEALDLTLQEVLIYDLKDGTFYAHIILDDGTVIDSRPSDAIALAVRTQSPIYVAEDIMAEAGILPESEEDLEEEEEEEPYGIPTEFEEPEYEEEPESEIERLRRKLEKAIEEEDYELAAQLRDQIKRLEEEEDESSSEQSN